MATAVCIQCGDIKKSPFSVCEACNYSPQGDHRAMAKSLLLSDSYYDPERDYKPGKTELLEMSKRLRSGDPIEWDESTLASLMEEQRRLEQYGSPSWLRIALLLLAMFLIPMLAIIVYFIKAAASP